jgi:hypothetical protein
MRINSQTSGDRTVSEFWIPNYPIRGAIHILYTGTRYNADSVTFSAHVVYRQELHIVAGGPIPNIRKGDCLDQASKFLQGAGVRTSVQDRMREFAGHYDTEVRPLLEAKMQLMLSRQCPSCEE